MRLIFDAAVSFLGNPHNSEVEPRFQKNKKSRCRSSGSHDFHRNIFYGSLCGVAVKVLSEQAGLVPTLPQV